jgi:hypothetical protein
MDSYAEEAEFIRFVVRWCLAGGNQFKCIWLLFARKYILFVVIGTVSKMQFFGRNSVVSILFG